MIARFTVGVAVSLLLAASGASARVGHVRHALPAKCAPGGQVLLADAQAQVYAVFDTSREYFNIRACAYGQRRSLFVSSCNTHEAAAACAMSSSVTLAGPMVAYEESLQSPTRDVALNEPSVDEWYVVAQNLLTGRILHKVPTGSAAQLRSGYVGVGPLSALVLKSDGAVAWIAVDYERSRPDTTSPEAAYFDVYALDKSGTRLLTAGTSIDPVSLALAVGGINVPYNGRSVTGSTLYWTSGGTAFSTSLN